MLDTDPHPHHEHGQMLHVTAATHSNHLYSRIPNNFSAQYHQRRPTMTGNLHRTLKKHHGKLRTRMKKAEKCVVCQEKASGMYFGAMVCLPCKSFFIRCTKDGKPQLTCLGEKNCSIDRTNRMRCQYCRYQKCLSAGMMRREKPETVEPGEGQELCHVCCDIANGIHFGVMTCEGCKKFFRRALKEAEMYECKQQQMCTLNPRNRNACRFCRYQKCIDVGMSRQAIRMGRPKKIKTEADSQNYEFCNYNTNTMESYYSKYGLADVYSTNYKCKPEVSYESVNLRKPAYYQVQQSPIQQSQQSYNRMAMSPQNVNNMSPGHDSGIESDCGSSPQHPSSSSSFFSTTIKSEPIDIFDTISNSGSSNGGEMTSQCRFQHKPDAQNPLNVTNCNNYDKLNETTISDFKTGQNEFDALVTTVATEIDIEDMNDILAELGQHLGSLGPQQFKNFANYSSQPSEQTFHFSERQQQQHTFCSQPPFMPYTENNSCREQTFQQKNDFVCQNSFQTYNAVAGGPVWPSWSMPNDRSSYNSYYCNNRQPVFPMS